MSSNAHAEVMREGKAGMMEYQLEARFLYHCASQLCGNQPGCAALMTELPSMASRRWRP